MDKPGLSLSVSRYLEIQMYIEGLVHVHVNVRELEVESQGIELKDGGGNNSTF